jgi:squalene synthase HpnC
MPKEHYENFPVASMLLPAKLRHPVQVIYAFARNADDFADEGDASPIERLGALQAYEEQLNLIEKQVVTQSILFNDLAQVIKQHDLPMQAFRDLLSAFKQDVVTTRYADFANLQDYCSRSANPVGRIMLHLYKEASPQNLVDSDLICTSLQIINFWQDIAIDWKKNRVYIPEEDLNRFHISELDIENAHTSENWQALIQFEIDRARKMMLKGSHLPLRLKGRVGFELRLVVQGGLRVLEKIELVKGDVFHKRPIIKRWDYCIMLWRALTMKI